MNPDLQNKIWLGLFGISGPVAKGLSIWFGLDIETIKIVLDILMIVTPSISGWIMAQMSTIANKMAHIEAMNPADQARIATALSPAAVSSATAVMVPADQAKVAASLPETTIVDAAAAIPDVTAISIRANADNPALTKMAESDAQPFVVPASKP